MGAEKFISLVIIYFLAVAAFLVVSAALLVVMIPQLPFVRFGLVTERNDSTHYHNRKIKPKPRRRLLPSSLKARIFLLKANIFLHGTIYSELPVLSRITGTMMTSKEKVQITNNLRSQLDTIKK
jgi:hypothetical protein